jgi:putative transposase
VLTKAHIKISFKMTIVRRKFTDEQKLKILREAEEMGITLVLRNHNLSYSAFARWRQQFAFHDPARQQDKLNHHERSQLKQYKTENQRLKKIIADQALEIERKEEELKKNNHGQGKR